MKRLLAGTLVALFIAAPAFAITGTDILDKMTPAERNGYLSGAMEMAITLASNDGNASRATCISEWYFKGDGSAQKTVIAALDKYRDKPAGSVIAAVINRACPAK